MKRMVILSILAVVLAFMLPVLLSAAPARRAEPEPEDTEAPAGTEIPAETPGPTPVLDASILLTVHTDAGDVEMTMADYLPLALAGEMPASFEPEALKAQAVALRSYVLYYRDNHKDNHPDADVCTSAGCCAAFADAEALRENWGEYYDAFTAKLAAAVADTDGQYLVYGQAPILAVFHSSSPGVTEDGAALGVSAPYLVSVSSPETAETVSNLLSTVEVSAADFRETVHGAFPAAALDAEDPAAWLGAVTLNSAGRVSQMQLGGVSVSGLVLRQLFSLRSTDFTLDWDAEAQCFVFHVRGYGHGMGMSQYGANLMARTGADYMEVLSHYYPGTELVMAVVEQQTDLRA